MRCYCKKKLEKSFKSVEFAFLKKPKLEEEFVNKLIKVYINRRLVKFKIVGFTEQYIHFIKQYIKESEDICLAVCYIDGNIAAYNLGAVSKDNTICVLILTIDSNYMKNCVGNILLFKTINYLIDENNKIENNKALYTYYDLTRGEELYKYRFGGIKHTNYHFIITVNKKLLNIYELNSKMKSVLIKLIVLFKEIKNGKT